MKKALVKAELNVKDKLVGVLRVGNVDYISLTDIAKYKNEDSPADVINKWMTNKDSFDFYSLWEELNNEDFNFAECREIKINEVGYNSFTMSPTKWVKRTNAIGIIPSSGRYSKGTFAHPDIALEFASWVDVAFKLYLIKEFERLKTNEAYQNKIQWSVRRSLSKTNYRIHTDAIKENIIPLLSEKQKQFVYADEADVLNVALFGMTAKQWRDANPDLEGNMRDNTDILHLVVLNNLEILNAQMIENGIPQAQRLQKLNIIARKHIETLMDNKNIKYIEKLDEETSV